MNSILLFSFVLKEQKKFFLFFFVLFVDGGGFALLHECHRVLHALDLLGEMGHAEARRGIVDELCVEGELGIQYVTLLLQDAEIGVEMLIDLLAEMEWHTRCLVYASAGSTVTET